MHQASGGAGRTIGNAGDRNPQTRRPRGPRQLRGIVIANGSPPSGAVVPPPTVVAFIWGGKVRPVPGLPYGRLRGAA